jgi:hypothetical protein
MKPNKRIESAGSARPTRKSEALLLAAYSRRSARSLHAEGAVLYLWSTGGADYAQSVANDLGIETCFAGFLPKTALIIDDQAVQDWRDCKHERPI